MNDDAPGILAVAVDAALKAAHQNDIRSIAMPAIGTGVFAFPSQRLPTSRPRR
jgi:O-acetyl-ADP-ribose deacetylase (regulator of RNase III)